ncbi:MAG: beta-N-acetylhexosaminidase [Muribaculaceae bacterium]|nr:beta-N-acetylhexosaminidase [Muribaculaceae bacterium]
MKNKFFLLLLLLGWFTEASATIENLMPRPKQVEVKSSGGFSTGRQVILTDPTESSELQRFMADCGLTAAADATAKITVKIAPVEGAYDYELAEYPAEAYKLTVNPDEIEITAPTALGVIRAAQTLRLMAQDCGGEIEGVTITDWPAFKLRGFMHDVGRSFIPLEELKREIDLLSRFKVNTFHWHLTDYTGWRLEIKAYPQLTGARGITRFPGKYYTQAEARELQDYAAERGVIIIPEIDMPGHSHPFEQAMGHSMQTDEGKAELKVILNEVAELFDKAPYIHIGGDEIGFQDSYIIEMINYVHSLGKRAVIWNRYNRPAKTVDPAVIPCDLTTNWATSGTLSPGVPNIDMRYNYTNHFDVFADVVGIFKSTIFGQTQGNPDVAGTISAAWNDTMTPTSDDIVRQNNVYANILASSERAWTGGGEQYIEQGGVTLPNSGAEFDEFADWERRFLYHKNTTMSEAAEQIPYVKQTNIHWQITDQIPNGGNPDAVLEPEKYIDSETMPSSIASTPATGAGIYLRHIWHPTVKGFYDNPQNGMTAYAWTYVYSPVEQDAGALIEFYTYSRSGNEKSPESGKWDRRGSRIWLNGKEIHAPVWEQPGADIKQDQDNSGLANENFTARPPVNIHLNEGWNKVFLKLPHANSGGTARDKWQFTFVITDTEGRDALEGLIYSPNKILQPEAESLMTELSDMQAWRKANVSSTPGFYPESIAEEFDRLSEEISATLGEEISAEERKEQSERLKDAFDRMKAAAAGAGISMPIDGATYALCTPLRDGRYVASQGLTATLTGVTTLTDEAKWKFVKRADGVTYNIINAANGGYVGITAANNSSLRSSKNTPSRGWTPKGADEIGYMIITSNTVQWNQTNSSLNYAVYNWGDGNNISDSGCKFRFETIELPEPPVEITEVRTAEAEARGVYTLTGVKLTDSKGLRPGIYLVDGKKSIVR